MTNRAPSTPTPTSGPAAEKSRPKLRSIRDAAFELTISERTVWRLLGLGELVKVKIGRSVRVTAESIDSFIKRGGAE